MNSIPSFTINPGDLRIVGDLLGPYSEAVQKTLPPSPAREEFLQRVASLRERISTIGVVLPGTELPFILTTSDITIILSALELFIAAIPMMALAGNAKQHTIDAALRLHEAIQHTFQQ